MSSQINEFLDSAKWIHKLGTRAQKAHIKESYFRASASRSYYAAYHSLRDFCIENYGEVWDSYQLRDDVKDKGLHERLIRFVRNEVDRTLSAKMSNLKALRTKADYQILEAFNESDAIYMQERCAELVERCKL